MTGKRQTIFNDLGGASRRILPECEPVGLKE
jgi:hypothetical protein